MNRPLLTLATALALGATAAVAQPTIDGKLSDTQYTPLGTDDGGAETGFGVPTGNGAGGSILTAAYAYADPAARMLYLGFGGTIENNGNRLLVFLDTRDGGYNTDDFGAGAGVDGNISTNFNNGGRFSEGFLADFVVEIRQDNSDATDTSFDVFVDIAELRGTSTDATNSITRSVYDDGATSDVVSIAFGDLPSQAGKTTADNTSDVGIEIAIPYNSVGASASVPLVITRQTISVFAIITGQDTGFMSNQTLSPLPSGTANLGNGPANFETLGAKALSYTGPVGTSTPDSPEGGSLVASALFPNPTAGASAQMTLESARAQAVTVEVFDALGRRVATAFDGPVSAETTVTVPTATLAPGLYVVRVQGETASETRLLTVMR